MSEQKPVRWTMTEAQEAALDQYWAAAAAWTALEARYRTQGAIDESEYAHQNAMWVLRAYRAERDS